MPSGTAKIIDTGTTHWVNRKDYTPKADLRKIVEEFYEGKIRISQVIPRVEKLLEVGRPGELCEECGDDIAIHNGQCQDCYDAMHGNDGGE